VRVIDSSAIIKFFSKEPGWSKVKKYLIGATTTDLAIKELGNALWKKVRRNEMRLEDANEILKNYPLAVNIVKQREYLEKSLEIAAEHGITLYDSLFIAVALENGYELITCDRKQVSVATELGVKAIKC
jgi:predicted nucleic acid-binding protein